MTSREKLLQKFAQEYDRLNEEQKLAVDRIEGPVMVIAGPGTGKTQILSVRIGKILLETDAEASNILCLTYTDAGVLAMRKRLLSLIGPDAYSVNIHSFHSFCNMVIQQNMHLFNKKEMQPVNELEQMQFLVQLIDSFDIDNPLKRYKADAYYEAGNLRQLFSAIKREGWTIEYLLQKIEEYVEEIPEKFYNKIKFKKGVVELTVEGKKEYEKMTRLKAAVQAFPHYQQILKENLRYDFDDMINWVTKAFEKDADLLLSYQEQYQYFLVDEYQDTSGSQNRLVELLVSYWEGEKPNLFVVGDDDQSIYRFQGANLENMMMLSRRYEADLLKIVLTKNYRSTQPILDAARQLIENNQQRLTKEDASIQKVLSAAKEENINILSVPKLLTTNNEFEENIVVTEEIKKLVESGIEPGRIAVIYKEHKTGDELQKFLQLQNIPFYAKKSINLLNERLIKKVVAFIRYVNAEKEIPFSGEPYLFEILHYDLYKIPALKIAALCHELNQNHRSKKEVTNLRQSLNALTASNASKLFSDDPANDSLIRVHEVLEKLIAESSNLPLLKWVEMLFNETGILSWIIQQPEKGWLMKELNAFFDYLQDECRRNQDLDLKGFVRQLDLLEENNIAIPLVQTSGNDKGVNLLTCHGSKGLEYEHVFFIGCYSGLWESKRKPSQGYKLPPNVFSRESAEEKEEELRRLFFVATTRAEKKLYISYPQYTNEGKALEPSRFITEMNGDGLLQSTEAELDEELKLVYSTLRYGIVQQPELMKAEKDYIDNLLQNFKMNVTALNNYLECPIRFYYSSLVRVPSAKNESAQFGSSMHDALSFFINKMMEEKHYGSKEVLLNRFQWHLTYNREVFTPASFGRFLDYGKQCLTAYYDAFFTSVENEFIKTEVLLEAVIADVPVKGFADKIQYWGNEIVITDFKTGSLEKSTRRYEFAEPGHAAKPHGGNYWRQAVVYKLLSDRTKNKPKLLRHIEFQFIEPNDKGEFDVKRIAISPAHEAIVQQQITEVWNKIQAHDFYKGCGKEDCEWCNFVKDHKLYVSLHEAEEETVAEEIIAV
jgi:DNA helicase-2/ATP-dependent DNA helicase PcrA